MFRLERDLEEGSRRLAMSHGEIRRLTEELESARLTLRAYGTTAEARTVSNIKEDYFTLLLLTLCFLEPELQAAQQEVEQLRQEVEKLKMYGENVSCIF